MVIILFPLGGVRVCLALSIGLCKSKSSPPKSKVIGLHGTKMIRSVWFCLGLPEESVLSYVFVLLG